MRHSKPTTPSCFNSASRDYSPQKLFRPVSSLQSVTGDYGNKRMKYKRYLIETVLGNIHRHWNLIINTVKLL